MSDYQTVAADFPTQASAESAITALKAAGFHASQIGVAASDSDSYAASDPDAKTVLGNDTLIHKTEQKSGSAWEKFKGMFEGNAAEPYAGETTKETFNDNMITPDPAYRSEDLHGSLTDLSVAPEHSRYFGHKLGSSHGAVVTVNAAGREDEAAAILEEAGGDIGEEAADYDYASTPAAGGMQNIQLYGEVLRVHKDRMNRGEVRIRKEVTTTTQTVEVPVTREELVVERVPVTGERAASGATFQGEEIRIPLSEERARITKEAVVREEVRVGKKEVTNVESHDEQVRSEDLKIDQDGNNPMKTGTY